MASGKRQAAVRHVRTSLIKWSNYFILQHFWKAFQLTAVGCRLMAPGSEWRRMPAAAITHTRIVWGAHTHTHTHTHTDRHPGRHGVSKLCRGSPRVGSGLVWLVSGPSLGLSSARTCTYHTSPPIPCPSSAPFAVCVCVHTVYIYLISRAQLSFSYWFGQSLVAHCGLALNSQRTLTWGHFGRLN